MIETPLTRTEISTLGEFGLIDHITKHFPIKNEECIKGVGDDAAVIEVPQGQLQLISKDLLVEGVHFDLTYTPLKHLGYKAVAVNLSDIAAMNALPRQILVGIAISNRFSLEAVEELYSGMQLCCERYGVDLIGGDTTSSQSGLFISVTVLGQAPKEDICYRNAAKENDLVCVSGDLGAAYAGLLLLEREKQTFLANPNMQPDFKDFQYVLERQLKPEPRLDIIKLLKEREIKPHAMIDISDGLASEILHICKQSETGCQIYENKIPIDAETCKALEMFNIVPAVGALNGGEDYELLFTLPIAEYEKIKDLTEIHIIGHITDAGAGVNLIPEHGELMPLTAQGWDSFK